jgi:hypothetical protein
MIPSWGLRLRPSRVRLFALLAVRDAMGHLPELLENIVPQVDGIVALDDGSRDGSGEFLQGRPEIAELMRNSPQRPHWDEMANHRQLVGAALRQGAEWALCIDQDERLEREFRTRAERVIERGRRVGSEAFGVRVCELWDSRDRYRADGIWGAKTKAALFRLRADHEFDPRPMHGHKAPMQEHPFRRADLLVYHLGMLSAADRERRRARYEQLDPDARWQAVGYAYLTDESGLRLRPVRPRRGFDSS